MMPIEMLMKVPMVDPGHQDDEIAAEVSIGWRKVLRRSGFIHGDEVSRFERDFASFSGVDHCVGVASGTDAMELALRAVGVGPGDEVIVPVTSSVTIAFAVIRTGAAPIFVDVDPATFLIDMAQVRERIGPLTRAVVPVHLYGQMAPIEEIRAIAPDWVVVVEDATQAQGARRHGVRAGVLGDIATAGLCHGKDLGAFGDAGAVLTNHETLAQAVRALGNHGSASGFEHQTVGFNSRMDTLQAVVLSAKLARLERWNELRRTAAARYRGMLSDIDEIVLPMTLPSNDHVWYRFAIRVPRRDKVLARLREAGIGAGVHYPVPIHLLGAFRAVGYRDGDFPVSEAIAHDVLSLPMCPHITPAQQERVTDELELALR